MPINFTPEQQKVIELHNRNILVSAAAGSGKTAVLVERIIRMVCDEKNPVDIDRLLIVTFTNAAAAEMRERIAAGIADRLRENPESAHIQRQSTLLHNAQITTIDSFSLFIIRNHFNEIGLDPAFRVADEGEIKLLQQDVLAALLEDKFAEKDEAFENCVEYFCPGGRERVLEQHILNLSRYAASFPWPEEWLLERKKDYEAEDMQGLLDSDYGRYLKGHVEKLIRGCEDKLENAKRLCEEPDGPYMYAELLEQEINMLDGLSGCASLADYAAEIGKVSFSRLPTKKDESVSAVKRELAKSLRSEVKDTLKDISEKFFATPLELALTQGHECMEPVAELIDLVLEFDRRMLEKKQERKIIDFSDMEHYALNILVHRDSENGVVEPSAVALEYRQYFEEILIDEYQDSNLVQEYLLKAVSGEDDGHFNRFMVGDVKQSIYKFRLARPELFLEKYESYGTYGVCTRIDLSRNFRSRTQVVDSVNGIFSRIMGKDTGGIEYDDRAALYPGASYPEESEMTEVTGDFEIGGGVGVSGNPGTPESNSYVSELILVEKPEKGGGNASDAAKQAEAQAVACRIKELHSTFKVTDKASGELRPAKYSDMVILLRTNSGWDEEFKKVLEDEGIPAYITSKTGYFSASEVQELLQFLRVLDNPLQDIPLFGSMKSIFGGFSDEEIAIIRGEYKGCRLYEAVCRYCGWKAEAESGASDQKGKPESEDDGNTELIEKCNSFLKTIEKYRNATVYLPIRELLQHIVDDFNYLDYVTALPAGSKRRANVEMLFTKASDFENTSYFGLFHFVRYMEQLEKYDVDYGEADTLDENADVVRIMSIHKSKGLEFPITFVSGLSKRFNMQDANQSLIVDMDLGLACDYVNLQKRVRNKTLRRAVLSRKMREDSLAEELRILYVALTRAKEKLIMTASLEGACEKVELLKERDAKRLTYLDFIEAGSYLDFILPVIDKSNVKLSLVDNEIFVAEKTTEQVKFFEKKIKLEHSDEYADKQALEELRQRFSFVYPYESMEKLYTKTTVSELKIAAMAQKDEAAYHTFEEKEVVPYIPAFKREEEKVSGTVRGNAYHRVMELLDFQKIMTCQDKEDQAQVLHTFLLGEVESRRLSEEYFEAVSEQKLLFFLSTDLAERMCRAQREGKLYREQPFVMGISADRLGKEFPGEETVLIQGIIDVFFEEEDGLVLLDYKTDSVGSMKELWNRYETQLDYYQEALQKLTGKPVKERILYSFRLGEY